MQGAGTRCREHAAALSDTPHDLGLDYGIWLARQRERRRVRLRQSLIELCVMAEQAQDHADALTHAGELLALEPLSEQAHWRVMRLHYLTGDRAAARGSRLRHNAFITPPSLQRHSSGPCRSEQGERQC